MSDELRTFVMDVHTRFIKEPFNRYVSILKDNEMSEDDFLLETIHALTFFSDCIEKTIKEARGKLFEAMQATGVVKYHSSNAIASLVEPTPSCIVTNPDVIAAHYPDLMSPPKPNKTEIAKRLRRGETIEGATLSNGGPRTLRITSVKETGNPHVQGEPPYV